MDNVTFGAAVAVAKKALTDPSVIEGAVSGWLDDHPEATTTVQDGSITKAKLDASLQETVDDVGDLKAAVSDLDDRVSQLEEKAEYELLSTDSTVAFTKTVPDEAVLATVDSTGTETIVFNQLFQPINETFNNIEYSTNENTGWVSCSGESNGNTAKAFSDAVPAGHKGAYIVETDGITLNTSLSAGFQLVISAYQSDGYYNGQVLDYINESLIRSYAGCSWKISVRCGKEKSVSGSFRVKLFDLTAMFGEGNEPSTIADFTNMISGGYYAYNTGTSVEISCDKVLLNDVEQTEDTFEVQENDVITIHTSCSVDDVHIPVASQISYYKAKVGPDEYIEESDNVTTYLLEENADMRIMLFTDNHSYDEFKYKKYADMMSHGVVDYLVGLGDYKDYSTTHDKIWYKEHLLNALTLAGRDANCLYAIGNHDVGIKGVNGGPNSADYMMSPKEYYDVFNRQYSKNPSIVYDPDNPTRGYGYYYVDNEAAKVRMIFLNSSDIFQSDGSFIRYKSELMFMSQQQLTWFAHTACKLDKDDPSEWAIVVFIHFAFPYGASENMLFKILAAVKAGSSIQREITVYNRLTLDGNTWTTTVDNVNGDTLSVNEDYSSQGAVDVCGIIYGHNHADNTAEYEGINALIVRCDNAKLDDYYLAPVSNYNAGKYYFTDVNGRMWAYEITSDYPTCAYVGYNKYFADAQMSPMPISRYDSNKNRIGSNGGVTRVDSAPSGATEITGFVSERGTSRIGQESAEILCIDKVNKTLTFIPYGTATKRTVSY